MFSCDDRAWDLERLAETEALIRKYEKRIDELESQSYALDTGQTRQSVTKANLSELRNILSNLDNRRATIRARLGCGQMNVIPGF